MSTEKWLLDAQGEPLVVYHGTRQAFDILEPGSPRGARANPIGVYFTAERHVAEEYAMDDDGALDSRSRVIAAHLSIESEADGRVIDHAYTGREYVMFDVTKIHILPERSCVFDEASGRWTPEQGPKPIVQTVYHGTNAHFNAFDCQPVHELDRRRLGAHFTDNPRLAALYGSKVIRVELTLASPLDLRHLDAETAIAALPLDDRRRAELRSAFRGSDYSQYGLLEAVSPLMLRKALEAAGFDGVVYTEGGTDAFIAFDPKQIRPLLVRQNDFDTLTP